MLNQTQLKHPAFLARVKAASVAAVHRARRRGAFKVGMAVVHNRKGAPSLLAVWHVQSRTLEYFDKSDRDVTAQVLAALRETHLRAVQ